MFTAKGQTHLRTWGQTNGQNETSISANMVFSVLKWQDVLTIAMYGNVYRYASWRSIRFNDCYTRKKMDISQYFLYAAGLLGAFAFGMFSFYHNLLVLVFNVTNFQYCTLTLQSFDPCNAHFCVCVLRIISKSFFGYKVDTLQIFQNEI